LEAVEPPYVSELTGVAEKSVELYVPLCKFDQVHGISNRGVLGGVLMLVQLFKACLFALMGGQLLRIFLALVAQLVRHEELQQKHFLHASTQHRRRVSNSHLPAGRQHTHNSK
jgi:hypothetical protein